MSQNRIQLSDLMGDYSAYQPVIERLPIKQTELIPEDDLRLAATKTAQDILRRSGVATIEVTEEDSEKARGIFQAMTEHQPRALTQANLPRPEAILKLDAMLQTYDHRVIQHADQIRTLVTNKLLELSDNRDPKVQLKAVELLGKLADVGMFVEKQEITYKQRSDEDIQQALKEKLGLLIEGDFTVEPSTPPVTPTPQTQAHTLAPEAGISAADITAEITKVFSKK
jgi:hypothetical protein